MIQFWVRGITGEDEAFRLLLLGEHALQAGIPNPGAQDSPLCDEWGIMEDPTSRTCPSQPMTCPVKEPAAELGEGDDPDRDSARPEDSDSNDDSSLASKETPTTTTLPEKPAGLRRRTSTKTTSPW